MARPRAADDFAAIRERMEELRRERVQAARGNAAEPSDDADQLRGRRFMLALIGGIRARQSTAHLN
jgi:hypothetical protein